MLALPVNKPNIARHLLAYALAVHFFFGSVWVLNELGLSFFYYYPRIIRITIFDTKIDLLVWIGSVLCVSALVATTMPKSTEKRVVQIGLATLSALLALTLLVTTTGDLPSRLWVYLLFVTTSLELTVLVSFRDRIFEQPSKSVIILTLVYLLAFFVAIEISSAVHNSLLSFDVSTLIGNQDAGTELQLSYASYGLLPWLCVGFLFSWAWVPIVQRLLPRTPLEHRPTPKFSHIAPNGPSLTTRLSNALDPKLLLAMAVAFFVGYYPYFQNPPWIVGTDAYWRYYDPLVGMSGKGPLGAFTQALRERHPVPLMMFYAAHLALQISLLDVVRLAQLLLVVVLALSMWGFLAYKRNFDFGLTVFLLSILSITTTIGFYTSELGNWMAIVLWVLFFAYLSSRTHQELGMVDFIVLMFLSTMFLIIHPWTWGVFATAVLVAAILALVHEKRKGLKSAGMLVAVILIDVAIALVLVGYLAASQGWKVLDAFNYYTFTIRNPSTVFWFWDALTWLMRTWSPFFSPLYFAVSIVGVYSLKSSSLSAWGNRLMIAWLFVSSIGAVLVAPFEFNVANPGNSGLVELWRLLFISPLSAFAPLGIAWLSQLPTVRLATSEQTLRKDWNGSGLPLGLWVIMLMLVGLGLSWVGLLPRLFLFLVVIPVVTAGLVHKRDAENRFLSTAILALFVLVAFNNTTRALSQLLRDPHNYRP